MNILIIGGGYVGLATAYLFRNHSIDILDTDPIQLERINKGEFPIQANTYCNQPNKYYDVVFICVPTVGKEGRLDTSIVESCIAKSKVLTTCIVVRSTVPIGFCDKHGVDFMPEFLTEAKLFDYNRLVYGSDDHSNSLPLEDVLLCTTQEAELIKLGSNAYLSTRLAFFSEIMTQCQLIGLDFDTVKEGICSDPRIGFLYAEKPFTIAGKCLPKDLSELTLFTNSPLLHGVLEIQKRQKGA